MEDRCQSDRLDACCGALDSMRRGQSARERRLRVTVVDCTCTVRTGRALPSENSLETTAIPWTTHQIRVRSERIQ